MIENVPKDGPFLAVLLVVLARKVSFDGNVSSFLRPLVILPVFWECESSHSQKTAKNISFLEILFVNIAFFAAKVLTNLLGFYDGTRNRNMQIHTSESYRGPSRILVI